MELQEQFRLIVREEMHDAIKNVAIKTTLEVPHAPVKFSYAMEDLGITDSRTLKRLIDAGKLKVENGKITWQSLHDYKRNRDAKAE